MNMFKLEKLIVEQKYVVSGTNNFNNNSFAATLICRIILDVGTIVTEVS